MEKKKLHTHIEINRCFCSNRNGFMCIYANQLSCVSVCVYVMIWDISTCWCWLLLVCSFSLPFSISTWLLAFWFFFSFFWFNFFWKKFIANFFAFWEWWLVFLIIFFLSLSLYYALSFSCSKCFVVAIVVVVVIPFYLQ